MFIEKRKIEFSIYAFMSLSHDIISFYQIFTRSFLFINTASMKQHFKICNIILRIILLFIYNYFFN